MIYLIGGPPKCGKTTLAKALSKALGISWISTDTLQCVIFPYISDEKFAREFPTSGQECANNDEKYTKYSPREIVDAYRTQARSTYLAIEAYIECEVSDGRDIIIEGYHIETSMIKRLETRFSEIIRSYILVKTDKEKLVSDFMKSTSLNDWIIKRTVYPETFGKIADMISLYSEEISTESHECEIQTLDMSSDFDEKIEDIIIKNS